MSTAGYLQDAKNQQKRLAETITAKGITATATEKYKDLVDKVAQIENLKGEERTLENFTNVLSEPKSIVQLEYPDNTPKTLNAKLGSKNIIPYPYPVQGSTINGITYTNNADGTVTATGTATDDSIYAPYSYELIFEIEPGTYTFSDDLTPTSRNTYWSEIRSQVDGPVLISSYDTNRTFTITEKTNMRMNLRVVKGQTIDITFKPHLVKGTATTAYTPYVSDLTSVTVTRCRKNLIPYPYFNTTKTLNGITFTVNSDGSVTVSGTATAQAYFKLQQSFSLKKGQYFFSGCPTGGSGTTYSLYLSTSDYKFYKADIGNGISINSEDDKTVSIVINIAKDTTVENLVFKPQLELGTSATPYEPYQGQTYTPTVSGEVTGITNLYPVTTLLTNNAGVVFEQITGGFYKEILPSTDKNGITKVYQPSVDNTIDSNITSDNIKQGVSILGVTGDYICNYTYNETTKELVLIL